MQRKTLANVNPLKWLGKAIHENLNPQNINTLMVMSTDWSAACFF